MWREDSFSEIRISIDGEVGWVEKCKMGYKYDHRNGPKRKCV